MFWRVWGAYLCALAGAASGRVGWRGGEDERRGGHGAGVEDRLCVGGDLGSLADGSGVAGEVDGVDPVEFAGDGGPGGAGVVLGDADEDQCGMMGATHVSNFNALIYLHLFNAAVRVSFFLQTFFYFSEFIFKIL